MKTIGRSGEPLKEFSGAGYSSFGVRGNTVLLHTCQLAASGHQASTFTSSSDLIENQHFEIARRGSCKPALLLKDDR
ncbi:hypothetical protein PGT21_014045 [Puccinia graminis f. sp. tritici]|uniref:Uncharacterized protein n=1 Tax=Puccinia graminis f. sp. tritici TaxID=56615 RepID=A0A5B0LPX2_PUCGR|nr:hypothetical protein PGT21_014045 [Puccinia graminis f. sp. tritici]KAA1104969.1 hypothetical protein PGTUg99_012556 [Puccinia graminis f. sp. tritici]